MSTVDKGADLYDQRHGHTPPPEPTAREVRDNPVARGRLIAQARSAHKLVPADDGRGGMRSIPDSDARRRARELLATDREAAATMARIDASDEGSHVGSYWDLPNGARSTLAP